MRLDQELVRRGLAASRNKAQELIRSGRVSLDGQIVVKAAEPVAEQSNLLVAGSQWVSRAALKLLGALEDSAMPVSGRALDAGASTGGFTQVLLERGAKQVYAVDVGHDQLADQIRCDPRVHVREGLNLRDLKISDLDDEQVDVLVCDVSFISLRLILAPMLATLCAEGNALLMIKPQFEVGRERLGSGGVVRDEQLRSAAIGDVLAEAEQLGWRSHWRADSKLAGQSGNVEHFVWLRKASVKQDQQDPCGCRYPQPSL